MLNEGVSWPFIESEFDRERYLGYYCSGSAFVLRPVSCTDAVDNETRNESVECTADWKEYNQMMQMTFYTFAGYEPYAKCVNLF